MTLSLRCSVVIEELASDKCTVKRRTALRESQISAVRDELQQILIRITPMNNSGCKKMVKKSMGYPVIELDLYKNFLSQGKATICLPVHSVRIMISNCPPDKLRFFLATLRTKLKTQKTHVLKRPVPPDAPPTSISLLEELSPLPLPKKINSHPKVIEPFSCDMSVINFQDEVPNTCSPRCGSLHPTPLVSTPVRKVAAKSRGDTNRSFGHIFDSRESDISSQKGHDEQMTVINFVKQGCNVFCTGGAGTGKSHLIRRVVGLLPPEHTAVTASTGSAANIIGGLTVHAFSGLGGLLESDLKMDKDNILVWMEILRTRLKFRPDIVTRWQKLQYLVIDEISMLSSRLFTRLELIATECRRSMNKLSEQKAFGGIQLVIFGDFFQLPPVVHPSESHNKFAFQSSSWAKCRFRVIELTHSWRQSNDPKLAHLLSVIREGQCPQWAVERLRSRLVSELVNDQNKPKIIATRLCTHRADADAWNQRKLSELPGSFKVYRSQDKGVGKGISTTIDSSCPAPSVLNLKVGAQHCRYSKTLNRVSSVTSDNEINTLQLKSNEQKTNDLINHSSYTRIANKKSLFTNQFQTQVIDFVVVVVVILSVKISTIISAPNMLVFECGQAYVALSRCRNLNGLYLLDWRPEVIRADPNVIKFYAKIRETNNEIKNKII
ncbi:ATP-dependent DNA helicase PIF1 [Schistosoma bovis]|uniref:ATP-dependent DNA helicase n=1 Tax=Schistosoma bovis TaxID=6184 RepID=A0A430Q879_SCHBO|nr:ATP-dependent DNA helicase PIF1 [Schistosoma bovis]